MVVIASCKNLNTVLNIRKVIFVKKLGTGSFIFMNFQYYI